MAIDNSKTFAGLNTQVHYRPEIQDVNVKTYEPVRYPAAGYHVVGYPVGGYPTYPLEIKPQVHLLNQKHRILVDDYSKDTSDSRNVYLNNPNGQSVFNQDNRFQS